MWSHQPTVQSGHVNNQPKYTSESSLLSIQRDSFIHTTNTYQAPLLTERAFLIDQLVKNLPAMQETPVRFLGQEDLLEEG